MKYLYTAIDEKGKNIKGDMVANSPEEVEANLVAERLTVLSIEGEKSQQKDSEQKGISFGKKVSLMEKIVFFANLASMLKAGLPIVEAIGVLKGGQKNKYLKEILDTISFDVEGGMTLSSSLSKYPNVFTAMDLSMFEVGETGGSLEENVRNLAQQLKSQKDLQSKVKSALMYPIVITVAMVLIGIILIVFVIPQISGFFEEANLQLPFLTRMLIALSELLIRYGLYVLALIIIGIFVYGYFYKNTKDFTRFIDRTTLKIPFAGKLIRKLQIARFTRTLSSLLKSGVSIVESLDITGKGFTNLIFREAIESISDDVERGESLADAIGKHEEIFYTMEIRLIEVGGKTGTVDESLLNVAIFYEEDVSEVLDNLASIIEPVLLLVMGVAVAIIAMSVISPIYQLVGGISEEA